MAASEPETAPAVGWDVWSAPPVLRIGAGERWCRGCGEIVLGEDARCHRCGGRVFVAVEAILHSEEYYVAQ